MRSSPSRLLAFAESSFFPIPQEALMIPLIVADPAPGVADRRRS